MLFRVLLPAIFIVAGVWPSFAAETPLQEGQNFYRARKALLRDGWRPIVMFDKDFDHDDPSNGPIDPDWPNARPFWLHGFREIESCNGTGRSYCGFQYRKAARCLFVLTTGEYGIKGFPPKISDWWTYPLPAKGKCSPDAAELANPNPRLPSRRDVHSVP